MRRQRPWKIVLTSAWLFMLMAASARDRQRTPDLSLTITDIGGRAHTPFRLGNDKAAVLFFILRDCPVSNRFAPEIARLVRDYERKSLRFYLVHVDAEATAEQIAAHAREYKLPRAPLLHDRKQQLVAAVGATVTPEVAVIGKDGAIVYRGRINNLYEAPGKPRRVVTAHDLRNALDAVLQNRAVPLARTTAIGCYIPGQN
ncbi:MAG: redoxin domain-containing protein [Blastocatellia bacterium]